MEEGRPRKRRMGKASQEGEGQPTAVEPMMMIMIITNCTFAESNNGILDIDFRSKNMRFSER